MIYKKLDLKDFTNELQHLFSVEAIKLLYEHYIEDGDYCFDMDDFRFYWDEYNVEEFNKAFEDLDENFEERLTNVRKIVHYVLYDGEDCLVVAQ